MWKQTILSNYIKSTSINFPVEISTRNSVRHKTKHNSGVTYWEYTLWHNLHDGNSIFTDINQYSYSVIWNDNHILSVMLITSYDIIL